MIKIDLNAADTNPESFYEAPAWDNGYHKGLLTMADIFAEAIYSKDASIDSLKQMLQHIRLNTIPAGETNVATHMPDGTEI